MSCKHIYAILLLLNIVERHFMISFSIFSVLLQNIVDVDNLHDNIIKITDFGLAREIEHTTHMSAAGTYPWMAPEVIRSSEFSQKSDVWRSVVNLIVTTINFIILISFGVVMWELLTGEKPYSGLNMYVVAYGVGSNTLNLPIPEDCPESISQLLKGNNYRLCVQCVEVTQPSYLMISV